MNIKAFLFFLFSSFYIYFVRLPDKFKMISSKFKNLIFRKNKTKNDISNPPLTENEINRRQIKAQLFKAIWEGNFSAPVESMLKSGIRVLEVR